MGKIRIKTIDTEKVKGSIAIRIPNYVERLKIVKNCNIQMVNGEAVKNNDQMDMIIFLLEKLPKYVHEVDIDCEGLKIKTIEEAFEEPLLDSFLSEVATLLINPEVVGNG